MVFPKKNVFFSSKTNISSSIHGSFKKKSTSALKLSLFIDN